MFAFRRSWLELFRERLCPSPIALWMTLPVGVIRNRFEMVFFMLMICMGEANNVWHCTFPPFWLVGAKV